MEKLHISSGNTLYKNTTSRSMFHRLSPIHMTKFSLTGLTCSSVRHKLGSFPKQVVLFKRWHDRLLSKDPCQGKIVKENLVVYMRL